MDTGPVHSARAHAHTPTHTLFLAGDPPISRGSPIKFRSGVGIFLQMYSQMTSMLYLSWAEMGMMGAPSATVPININTEKQIQSDIQESYFYHRQTHSKCANQYAPTNSIRTCNLDQSLLSAFLETSLDTKIWKICQVLLKGSKNFLYRSNRKPMERGELHLPWTNFKICWYWSSAWVSLTKSILFWRMMICFSFMISIAAKCSDVCGCGQLSLPAVGKEKKNSKLDGPSIHTCVKKIRRKNGITNWNLLLVL